MMGEAEWGKEVEGRDDVGGVGWRGGLVGLVGSGEYTYCAESVALDFSFMLC